MVLLTNRISDTDHLQIREAFRKDQFAAKMLRSVVLEWGSIGPYFFENAELNSEKATTENSEL